MLIICCKKVIVNIKDENFDKGLTFFGFSKRFNVKEEKKRKNKKTLVLISLVEVILKEIVLEYNLFIISPKIIFEKDYKIILSNNSLPESRKPSVSNIYGLSGLPGLPGYNLALISGNIICEDNLKKFISNGGTGGKGQKGNPGGIGGKGGKGGKLILNGECIKTGEDGRDGISFGDSEAGLVFSQENMEGINITAKVFSHFTYSSLSSIDETEKKEFLKLF